MKGSPKHSRSTTSESRPSKLPKTQDQKDKQLKESSMSKNPRIQRYLVAIEYIGTRFSGSQQQPNRRTVVGVLEEAFHKFIGQPVSIFCSSRTDAGVHALSNVCHVDVERISKRKPGEVLPPHEPSVVRKAVNHFLQKNEGDISVIDVRCVPNDFHARFKAQERTFFLAVIFEQNMPVIDIFPASNKCNRYFYRLVSGCEPLSAFDKERAWHVQENLDLYAMQEACKVLIGHHDFSSFRASGCEANSPIRTLDELHVCEVPATPYFPSITERKQSNSSSKDSHFCYVKPEVELPINSSSCTDDVVGSNDGKSNLEEFGVRRRHRCYVVTARSRSFLYHQVRLLVGVLKCAGTGELTTFDVERILNAKTITAASPMAPACGLYLGRVKYDLP